jgi:LmbE family N-acetylglucosaminyl deacetylase
MSALVSPDGQRVLNILAHPDDGESFTGGTMARLAQEGKEIFYLIATQGDKGSDDRNMTPEHLAAIREEEQREAARLLGVQSVIFLEGYSDGCLEPSFKLRGELVRKIRELKPDVVFTFDPWKRYEIHPDHRAIGLCAIDAIACARGWMNYPEHIQEGLSEHSVKQVYLFNTDQPNHYIDIATTLETKIAARCAHVSQIRPSNHPSSYLTKWAEEAGKAAGYQYAEAFHYMAL